MLQTLCERPDAQKSQNGLSALPADIVQLVTRDLTHWDLTNQFLHYCKPLVDAIGNLESRDANFADCMIELLRCAKHFDTVEHHPTDDINFTKHAKEKFTHHFLQMNTDIHWLALFLHPLCRKLAISQVAKSRTFPDAIDIALDLAKKWKWSKESAEKLVGNLRDYNLVKAPFTGGSKNARLWWEELPFTGKELPLKDLAMTIYALVPHSAEVERLFSSLGGIQGVRRSRLNVTTFEKLGRMRCYLNSLLHQEAAAEGRTLRRTHANMHTRPGGGVDEETVADLEKELMDSPVLVSGGHSDGVEASAGDDISIGELDEAFTELELSADRQDSDDGGDVGKVEVHQVGEVYDLDELDKVLKGVAPEGLEDSYQAHHNFEGGEVAWDKETLKRLGGVV